MHGHPGGLVPAQHHDVLGAQLVDIPRLVVVDDVSEGRPAARHPVHPPVVRVAGVGHGGVPGVSKLFVPTGVLFGAAGPALQHVFGCQPEGALDGQA